MHDGAKRSGDHQSEVPRPIAGLRNVRSAVTTVPIASAGQARIERQRENSRRRRAPQPGNLRAVRATAPVAAGWVSGSESVFPRRPLSRCACMASRLELRYREEVIDVAGVELGWNNDGVN